MLSAKVDSITIALKGTPNSGEFVLHGVFHAGYRKCILLQRGWAQRCLHNLVFRGAIDSPLRLKALTQHMLLSRWELTMPIAHRLSPQDLKTNLETIIRRVRESAPFATIILTTPGDFLAKGGKATIAPKIASEIIAYVAEENNCNRLEFLCRDGGRRFN